MPSGLKPEARWTQPNIDMLFSVHLAADAMSDNPAVAGFSPISARHNLGRKQRLRHGLLGKQSRGDGESPRVSLFRHG